MKTLKLQKDKPEHPNVKTLGEWRVAHPLARLGAQVIDQGLVFFATFSSLSLWFPQRTFSGRWWATLFLLWAFVSWLSQLAFLWFYRNTPGKKALGLAIQSARPHRHLIFSQVLIRAFTWWLGAFTLGAGWMTVLSRADRRAWHDFAADTIVVRQRGEPVFATEAEMRVGQAWLAILSIGFNATLGLLLILQLGKLSQINSTTLNSEDLRGMILKSEALPTVAEQKATLEKEIAKHSPEEAAYFDLKTALAQTLMRAGDFAEAFRVVRNDLEIISQSPPPSIATASARALADTGCQAQALASCQVESVVSCTDPGFWSDWNNGCKLKSQPDPFLSAAQALGFWWSKANQKDKFTAWDQWESTKNQFKLEYTVGFSKSLTSALDFAFMIRTNDPKDIMDRARKISTESPLWGWAQKRGFDRFGHQWALLVSPNTQKMMAKYKLVSPDVPERAVASEKSKNH